MALVGAGVGQGRSADQGGVVPDRIGAGGETGLARCGAFHAGSLVAIDVAAVVEASLPW